MKTEPIICSTQIITALVSQETMEIDAMELRRKELSLKRKALFAKIPKGFSEILTGKLWLGSGRDARQKKKLLELGITHIVNCAIEWKNHYPSTFMYFNGNVLDNEKQDLSVFFSGAFDFLDEVLRVPSNRVFVHCVVGKSRSAALTMAYLMRMEHLTLNQAFNHVKACRPIVSPNDGFMRQLMAFEMHMFSTTSPSMVWGEWKNQSKCALAPLDSISQDQDNNINSNNKENFPSSSSSSPLDKDNEMTNTTTTTSNNTNNNNDDLLTRSPQAKYHRTELQQAALDSFVQTHITPELLQKGLTEVCGGVYDSDCVGNLLQWVHHGIRDSTSCAEGVRREGIPWRDIAHSIDESAKQWLRQQEHSTKTDVAT